MKTRAFFVAGLLSLTLLIGAAALLPRGTSTRNVTSQTGVRVQVEESYSRHAVRYALLGIGLVLGGTFLLLAWRQGDRTPQNQA
jgi:hypothetical protein